MGRMNTIRFTVNEENTKPGKAARNIIHSSAISKVSIYKNGNNPQRIRDINPGEAEPLPFIDKRLQHFFSSVNPSDVSVVRDEETREPVGVYHGTHAKFDVFDRNKGELNDAGWSG